MLLWFFTALYIDQTSTHVCACVSVYIYIYVDTCTYKHTHLYAFMRIPGYSDLSASQPCAKAVHPDPGGANLGFGSSSFKGQDVVVCSKRQVAQKEGLLCCPTTSELPAVHARCARSVSYRPSRCRWKRIISETFQAQDSSISIWV